MSELCSYSRSVVIETRSGVLGLQCAEIPPGGGGVRDLRVAEVLLGQMVVEMGAKHPTLGLPPNGMKASSTNSR